MTKSWYVGRKQFAGSIAQGDRQKSSASGTHTPSFACTHLPDRAMAPLIFILFSIALVPSKMPRHWAMEAFGNSLRKFLVMLSMKTASVISSGRLNSATPDADIR